MKNKLWWQALGLCSAALFLIEFTVFVIGMVLGYCLISHDVMANLRAVPMSVVLYAAIMALLGAYVITRGSSYDGTRGLEDVIRVYRESVIYWNVFGLGFVIVRPIGRGVLALGTGIALLASKMCPSDDPRKLPD